MLIRLRTRNFRAPNEKSQKGEQAAWTGRWENATIGRCSKGDSCSFSHDPASGKRDQRQEGQSSSPAPEAKAQTDGQIPSKKFRPQRGKSFWNKGQNSVPKFPWVKAYVSVMYLWAPYRVSMTSLNQDATMATNADSDTLRLMDGPA